ncbi:MAG: exodeoxyribonuclease VII large subunit [Firmicutes bacterium]|nr:exodeoxyribonuclease VII large subunit [Bacillota bacterium]
MAIKPVSVSQLNGYIKRILQTDPLLGNVSVVGEVSNLKYHGSGHVYFTLKDANSKISCFLPHDRAEALRYELSEGMEITASGYIYLYERGGSYSLNIRDIEVAGLGNLAIAFEKLKSKLEAEGLFDPAKKKAIPSFPEKIAVVTSETGAAVRDILKIIKNRNDYVDVLIYPVLVQGPAAAGEIAAAINHINEKWPDTDTIITGRGGGSMEELWAFNEEIVARAIYASAIPVISAVGHETDFTIADFAADIRAETPTAAAHMAVPDINELKEYISTVMDRLSMGMDKYIQLKEMQLKNLDLETFRKDLESRITMEQMRIDSMNAENMTFMQNTLNALSQKIESCRENLEALDPTAIMKRGYSAVTDSNGTFINTVKALNPEDKLIIHMHDGNAACTVDEVRGD